MQAAGGHRNNAIQQLLEQCLACRRRVGDPPGRLPPVLPLMPPTGPLSTPFGAASAFGAQQQQQQPFAGVAQASMNGGAHKTATLHSGYVTEMHCSSCIVYMLSSRSAVLHQALLTCSWLALLQDDPTQSTDSKVA